LGYEHLLAGNNRPDRQKAEPPGVEPWVGPLWAWAKEWAREMDLSGHPARVARRLLPRLAADAMVGRLCDASHRGARLRYIATLSRIRPDDLIRVETFVCVVQRALEEHYR
jgi:hypothetical protein